MEVLIFKNDLDFIYGFFSGIPRAAEGFGAPLQAEAGQATTTAVKL